MSEENPIIQENYTDLKKEFYTQYRLLRKKISAFIRERLQKKFVEIIYITAETPPYDFILSLQKQYPDKIIKLLVPVTQHSKDYEKTSISFDYFLQNQNYTAEIFRLPSTQDNIKIYGIYSNAFEDLTDYQDLYKFKYLAHFIKTSRKTALKLKPDIIYADSIPLMAGLEFGTRWDSGYPIKFVQTFHDLFMYDYLEPFWAAINLVNKNEMKRICTDSIIKYNVALLFNIQNTKKFTQMRECLNDFYTNYETYRENVNINQDTKENIIINRLNERIIKMFPNCITKDKKMYNIMYYSFKKASKRCVNNLTTVVPEIFSEMKDFCQLKKQIDNINQKKIIHPFDESNFREIRNLNKRYLIKELSEKRIETKFISPNLFMSEEVNICGFLESYFKNTPLLFVNINQFTKEEDIKTVSIALLNLFQQRKNIQVIYNFPHNYKSEYLQKLIDFLESQPLLKGKWISIEGDINLPQFMSSADMILLSSANDLYVENNLYIALKHGCIPVTTSEGSLKNIVIDIFDDMNFGNGFITKKEPADIMYNTQEEAERTAYGEILEKAVNFYVNNNSSWNILVKNALNYNNNWDFQTIEDYNNVFDDII